jgi:hypothetical protein
MSLTAANPEAATASRPSITLRTLRLAPSDPRWENFVGAHPQGTIYHHPAWVEVLEQEQHLGAVCLACEDDAGMLRGILPMVRTRGLPFRGGSRTSRRWSSLPRTPLAGPLALDGAATGALLGAAMEWVGTDPGTCLELRLGSASEELPAFGFGAVPWLSTYTMDLPAGPSEVRFGNSRNHARIKWAVNKAARLGVEVRSAEGATDLRRWYSLYMEVMRRHAAPPRPYRFFELAWDTLMPRGLMRLLLAERTTAGRRELLAGSIFFTFGPTVYYAFNGCAPSGMQVRANDVIQWQAIHDATQAGCRHYDMGDVNDEQEGLRDFKSKWGAEPRRLYRYYYPALGAVDSAGRNGSDRASRVLKAAWRRLPLPATAVVGSWLYRFM